MGFRRGEIMGFSDCNIRGHEMPINNIQEMHWAVCRTSPCGWSLSGPLLDQDWLGGGGLVILIIICDPYMVPFNQVMIVLLDTKIAFWQITSKPHKGMKQNEPLPLHGRLLTIKGHYMGCSCNSLVFLSVDIFSLQGHCVGLLEQLLSGLY